MFPSMFAYKSYLVCIPNHPRMGRVPPDPYPTSTKASTTSSFRGHWQVDTMGLPNVSHNQLPPSQIEIFANWHHLPCIFPENVSHSIMASSDEVCIDMARFFQRSSSSYQANSYQACHQPLQSFISYVMSDHICT